MKSNRNEKKILKFKKYQIANLNVKNSIKGGDDTLTETTYAKTIPTGTK